VRNLTDIQRAIDEGLRLLKTAKVAHFITMGEDGIQVRPMGAVFKGTTTGEVVLITYRDSRKVDQLTADPMATLYFHLGPEYVVLRGEATVGDDPEMRRKLWHSTFKRYFPGGVDDPQYVYITLKVKVGVHKHLEHMVTG
jgi:general stress protein 26